MKKYINRSIFYALLAMVGGVFYREFTKIMNFTGTTSLGKVHVHLLVLGTFAYLIAALFSKQIDFEKEKSFKLFKYLYDVGLLITVIMLVVRGITQVLQINLSKGISASISGIAGIGHILTGVGFICLLISFSKSSK